MSNTPALHWYPLVSVTPDGDPDCWITDDPDMSVFPNRQGPHSPNPARQWMWRIWGNDGDSIKEGYARTKRAAMVAAERAWKRLEARADFESSEMYDA